MHTHFRKSFVAALIAIISLAVHVPSTKIVHPTTSTPATKILRWLGAAPAGAANCGSDLAELPALPTPISNFNRAGGQGSLFANGGPLTAPASATVMVDSGQLAPGCFLVAVTVANVTDTAVGTFTVHHRNAANNADVCTAEPFGLAVFATVPILASAVYQVQIATQNERVTVVKNENATAAKIWQSDMTVLPCP